MMAYVISPFKKYNYRVTIDETEEAGFSEVSSPDIAADPMEYRQMNPARKTPGILKYSNVTLKRGTTDSPAFINWMTEVQNNTINRKTVVITLVDDEGKDSASWQLKKAWPTKYNAPDFNSTSKEVAIESLELVCEGITRTM
ncbi:phage tail protein [Flavonifractor sp. An52]|uniref:phage tail protein n=1 Tax=Flavonifractor sp. An52 TaxID=1965642 RepID=UPI001FA8E900|nr:phage tail protein [Flavonifractor sp. An52]